jgi:hypothetical protein
LKHLLSDRLAVRPQLPRRGLTHHDLLRCGAGIRDATGDKLTPEIAKNVAVTGCSGSATGGLVRSVRMKIDSALRLRGRTSTIAAAMPPRARTSSRPLRNARLAALAFLRPRRFERDQLQLVERKPWIDR